MIKFNSKLTLYIIILIIGFLSYIFVKNRYIYESFLSYTKCDKYKNNNILQNILNKNYIKKTSKNNWDLYIPCTYTHVEKELKNLKTNNKNQKIFGINGSDKLAGKDNLWKIFENKYKRHLLNKILPETYILENQKHMDLFKKNYNKNNIYILKKNLQRKQGIKITKKYEDIIKAKSEDFVVVQKYIKNPYLINNRKVNLRIYILIICKNNESNWYISKLGKCIYANKNYNNNYDELESHITSINLDDIIYNNSPFDLYDLKDYLGNNYFDILFKRIIFICKLTKKCFKSIICEEDRLKDNTKFQLFGLDFIFDTLLKPYLLEFNKGPSMKYINDREKNLKNNIYDDIFDLINIKKLPNNKKNNFIKL